MSDTVSIDASLYTNNCKAWAYGVCNIAATVLGSSLTCEDTRSNDQPKHCRKDNAVAITHKWVSLGFLKKDRYRLGEQTIWGRNARRGVAEQVVNFIQETTRFRAFHIV
ncbi:MAG: hypothetical protein JNJ94_15605 [Chlorobi bacterium]|nr:hypothetical protein [Chlorobiota bacterium]